MARKGAVGLAEIRKKACEKYQVKEMASALRLAKLAVIVQL